MSTSTESRPPALPATRKQSTSPPAPLCRLPYTVVLGSTRSAVSGVSFVSGFASASSITGNGLTETVPIDDSPAAVRTRKGCSPGRQSGATSSVQTSRSFAASNAVPTQRIPSAPRASASAAVHGANVARG